MSERDERANAELDEQLSQLIDGELDAASARALRARVAQSPALARRLAELESVDEALRALPAPQVPSDLRLRLRARIGRVASEEAAPDPALVPASGAVHVPRRRRPAWIAAAALAASVALVIVLALRGGPPGADPAAPETDVARAPAPAPGGEATSRAALADAAARDRATSDPGERVETAGSIASAAGDAPTTETVAPTRLEELVEATPDEELAIALDYDALRDFEIIDQLELLEALAALDDAGASG